MCRAGVSELKGKESAFQVERQDMQSPVVCGSCKTDVAQTPGVAREEEGSDHTDPGRPH